MPDIFAANYSHQRAGACGLAPEHEATRALYVRCQRDLLAAVPTARIIELTGASIYMFLLNEDNVLREIRAFAAKLPGMSR